MANLDNYPEFPDYGEFTLDDQPIPSVQVPAPEPALLRPEPETYDDFPDFELDEYILELLRHPAQNHEEEVPTPSPPAPEPEPEEPLRRPTEEAAPGSEPLPEAPVRRLYPDETEDSEEAVESYTEDNAAEADETDFSFPDSEDDDEELETPFLRRVAERDAKNARRKKHRDSRSDTEDEPPLTVDDQETVTGKTPRTHSAFFEKLRAPLLRYFATLTAKKELREQEAANWPAGTPPRQTPELSPVKAMHYYATQLKTITGRLLLCLAMSLASLWIALGLPMAGQLGYNPGLQAAVCLCFMLAAMVAALDVVTTGIRQLFRFYFGMEALAVLSCFLCTVDAVLVMLTITESAPYCAVATLSLTAALWGERLFCLSSALNFGTAATAKGSTILSVEEDEESGLRLVCIRDRAYEGIVRRSEEPDISRRAYSIAAPCLTCAALILALLGSIDGDWLGLPHRLSSYLTAACALPAFLCFSLPYLFAAGRLRRAGAAVAGWPGCADMGRNRRMLVTDNDIFPAGSIRIYNGQMEKDEAEWQKRVTTYTVSLLAAAGSSSIHAFDELVEKYKCTVEPVEELQYYDGGGISGYIHHENVCIGSAGFMNLNGIRPVRQVNTENGICVAIGGKFVAVITLSYTPLKGAQQALRLLSRSRTQPVFAIRDFNITPLMIQKLFGIPALNFEFPSFKERFRLSTDIGKPDTPAAAVLTRHSLHSAVECAERSRRLYKSTLFNTILSIASSVLCLLLMFLLGRDDSAAVMSAGRLLGYMLFWTLPCLLSSLWVRQ